MQFFVPSLEVFSHWTRLSPNVASGTLLAFGHGAPDLSTSIYSMIGLDPRMGLNALLGSAVFVPILGFGIISIVAMDENIYRRPFARDCLILSASGVAIFFWVNDGSIYWWESMIAMMAYITYVLVVVIGRQIYVRFLKYSGPPQYNVWQPEFWLGETTANLMKEQISLVDLSEKHRPLDGDSEISIRINTTSKKEIFFNL
eukprot:UN30867